MVDLNQLLEWLGGPAITGIIVALFSMYISKKVKIFEQKLNLIEKYDIGLRDKRIEAYKELWKCMKPLGLESKKALQVDDLISIQEAFTNWYYTINGGGLFLTESSQKRYVFFITQLKKEIEKNNKSELDIEKIKNLASNLRTYLCKDVGTREESYIPSVYGDLKIEPKPENRNNKRVITFFITYYGNKSIRFSQDDLIFTIQNLNYNEDGNNNDKEYVPNSEYELKEHNRFKDASTSKDSDSLYLDKCELKPTEQIVYEWTPDNSDKNYYLVKIKINEISAYLVINLNTRSTTAYSFSCNRI